VNLLDPGCVYDRVRVHVLDPVHVRPLLIDDLENELKRIRDFEVEEGEIGANVKEMEQMSRQRDRSNV